MKKLYKLLILLVAITSAVHIHAQSSQDLIRMSKNLSPEQLRKIQATTGNNTSSLAGTEKQQIENQGTQKEKPTTLEEAYEYYDMSRIEKSFNARKDTELLSFDTLKQDYIFTPLPTSNSINEINQNRLNTSKTSQEDTETNNEEDSQQKSGALELQNDKTFK